MANSEKTRGAAGAALDTYKAVPGMDSGEDRDTLADLACDLVHLAEARGLWTWDELRDRIETHWHAEHAELGQG